MQKCIFVLNLVLGLTESCWPQKWKKKSIKFGKLLVGYRSRITWATSISLEQNTHKKE